MQFLLGKPVLSSQLLFQVHLLRALFTGPATQSPVTAPLPQHPGVGISKHLFLAVGLPITHDSRGKEGSNFPVSISQGTLTRIPSITLSSLTQKHKPKPGIIRLSCNVQ